MQDEDLSFTAFQRRLNQTFTMQLTERRSIEAVLTDCVPDTGSRPGSIEQTGFTLTFMAGPDAPIEQATYLMSADGLAPAPIFLVPRRQLPDGVEYQAVFNQLDEG